MTTPEIQRCNLASVALQLMALGISDVLHFDFLDRPSQDSIENALEQLLVLGAVRKGNSGYEVYNNYEIGLNTSHDTILLQHRNKHDERQFERILKFM